MSAERAGAAATGAAGFEAFVADRGPDLLSVARGLVAREADAEDLLQDALVRVLERWDRVSAADDPGAYAHRVLVTTAASRWRRVLRRPERLVDPSDLPGGAAGARAALPQGRVDDRLALVAALRALPLRQRAVLVLRHCADLPDEEVAAALGVRRATVRSLAARGAAALRAGGQLDGGASR